MKPKVDFLIAGTQKGGTTALHAYLANHPQLHFAQRKEVHFFDQDHLFVDDPDYARYHSFWEDRDRPGLMGEATPIYMFWQPCAERMYRYNPKFKLLLVLRNPVLRAFSNWNMEVSRGRETLSFWDAITQESERCQNESVSQHRIYSYVSRGFYAEQIQRLMRFFPLSQLCVLKNEDLLQQPKACLDQVCQFLQIDPLVDVRAQEVFKGQYENQIDPSAQAYLLDLYSEDIRALEKLLDWDCREWFRM